MSDDKMKAPLTGKASQHPAKQATRGLNDPVGGKQTLVPGHGGSGKRNFERGNPAKAKAKPL